ncbi:hypothetical protein PV387_23065 [Streptomyces sp. ME02-6987-2C]|uniref:hypothetical protein n=1 Tax=unclassified Streptomyces TaxID=2593676 RepID=UPI0029A2BF3E|nr:MULTISPECIES: hypothetical protein [unclassified Streptomyces]MDX3345971.1 hypothetical protein [Streptomyces sp. ME02-6979A]MDX3368883.1 hypothetical protein [Streptomyces sp. ME02-6987-2C]MDX3407780.1 hypothetical protein [Streptomyces sp. ME02-6977A]MDX3421737.1 hypothetical protein [Streptomyces sp. ME02-6985-2c]
MSHTTTELGSALRALGERGEHLLAFEAAPEQLDEIDEGLENARRLLAGARAELAPSGCRVHPSAPSDPASGERCLFCATNRRRGQAPGQPATVIEAVPLEQICRAVAEHGQDEAVRRFGARQVTRALLRCRFDPMLTEESA